MNAVIRHTGFTSQNPPGIFTSSCPIKIKWFPFDDQKCKLKFGSWTYDGTKIDLQIKSNGTEASLDGYSRSGEWDLLGEWLYEKQKIFSKVVYPVLIGIAVIVCMCFLRLLFYTLG